MSFRWATKSFYIFFRFKGVLNNPWPKHELRVSPYCGDPCGHGLLGLCGSAEARGPRADRISGIDVE